MLKQACALTRGFLSPDIRAPTGSKDHANLQIVQNRPWCRACKSAGHAKYMACPRMDRSWWSCAGVFKGHRYLEEAVTALFKERRFTSSTSALYGCSGAYSPVQKQGTNRGAHRAVLASHIKHSTGAHFELLLAGAWPRPKHPPSHELLPHVPMQA